MVGQNKPPTITFQNGSGFTMVESENKNVRGKTTISLKLTRLYSNLSNIVLKIKRRIK